INADFVVIPKLEGCAADAAVATTPVSTLTADDVLWQAAKESKNPRDVLDYIAHHLDGAHIADARKRLQELPPERSADGYYQDAMKAKTRREWSTVAVDLNAAIALRPENAGGALVSG